MKKWLRKYILPHKKSYIALAIVFLIVVIASAVVYFSYAYYISNTENLIVSGTASIEGIDIRLRMYVQDEKNGEPIESYYEVTEVEKDKYLYNPELTHCSDGESIVSVDRNVFTVSYGQKGSCSVYFDLVDKKKDISIKTYVEEESGKFKYNGTGTVDMNTYELSKELSDCTTNGEITDDNKADFTGKGSCVAVYVKKNNNPAPAEEVPSSDETNT